MVNRQSFLKYADHAKIDWGAAWEVESYNIIEKQFMRLKKLSEKHKFSVIIVAFPVAYQVYTTYIEDFPQNTISTIAKKYNFYFFDLLPLLRKHRDNKLFYDHCHPNDYSSEIIGKGLSKYLINDVFFNPPSF